MSGHNRWSKIKRQKEAMGASQGQLFTKIIKEITVAARMGGGDPAGNARLRSAMLAAREANMPGGQHHPRDQEGHRRARGRPLRRGHLRGLRARRRGGARGVLTDNRNRTAGDVRATFSKVGGNLARRRRGEVGSSSDKGSITVSPARPRTG